MIDRHLDAVSVSVFGAMMLLVAAAIAVAVYLSSSRSAECPPGSDHVWAGEDVVIVDGVANHVPRFECVIVE